MKNLTDIAPEVQDFVPDKIGLKPIEGGGFRIVDLGLDDNEMATIAEIKPGMSSDFTDSMIADCWKAISRVYNERCKRVDFADFIVAQLEKELEMIKELRKNEQITG